MNVSNKSKVNRFASDYEVTKMCPKCGMKMKYAYGETYVCTGCGFQQVSDFGLVKQFLDENGPTPAIIISEKTGVSVDYINKLLRQGRIEIPDGSDVYIKCEKCGTDIRYGRFCPDCMQKTVNGISNAMWMPEVGEKPKQKKTGKMRTADFIKQRKE